MSLPRSLDPPVGCAPLPVPTRRGPLAAIRLKPPAAASRRDDVLLVPGFTGSKEDFLCVLAPIAAAGYRVTAVDLRGQFDTAALDMVGGAVAEDEAAYAVPALAEDLLDVIADSGGPVHLLGHSFGGLVARDAALRNPGALRSLTLLGSGPAAIPPPSADRLVALRPVLTAGGVAAVWAAVQALEAAEPGHVPPSPAVAAFLRRRYLAMSPACLGGMATGLLTEPDRVEELAALDLPLLVVHGKGDDAWPPAVQREMAGRLRARYAVIADSLHSPAMENPADTAKELLDFWRSAEPKLG